MPAGTPEVLPDKLWLSHMVVITRQAQKQTGLGLMGFLELLDEQYDDFDFYDDQSIIRCIQSYMKKNYPEEPRKQLN